MSVRSATLKRLIKERQLMDSSPCREFTAEMLEDNALEWHFTMQGPPDSPYASGFYHGKILIPADYPFKPPDVILLTPNGRFELDKRICLSISSYHPENWHPTWGIATVLHALREFMATPGNNGIGAIEYPKAVREELALKSLRFVCPSCGCHVDAAKEKMLLAPPAVTRDPKEVVVPSTPLTGPASQTPQQSPVTDSQTPAKMEVVHLPEAFSPPTSSEGHPMGFLDASVPASERASLDSPDTTPTVDATVPDASGPPPQAAVPRAVPPPRGVVEHRNGQLVVLLSIEMVDRCIRVVLVLIAALLCKKATSDWWDIVSEVTRFVPSWLGW